MGLLVAAVAAVGLTVGRSDRELASFDGSIELVVGIDDEEPSAPPALEVQAVQDGSSTQVFVNLRFACGSGRAIGALLFVGQARIDPTYVSDGFSDSFSFTDENSFHDAEAVEAYPYEHNRTPCPGGTRPDHFGTVEVVAGFWEREVVEEDGLRGSAIGPVVRPMALGRLAALEAATPGHPTWGIPGGNEVTYSVSPGLTSTDELVGSPQNLISSAPLVWTATQPLRPMARWSSTLITDSLAQWSFLWGILAGIGGSMFATGTYALLVRASAYERSPHHTPKRPAAVRSQD